MRGIRRPESVVVELPGTACWQRRAWRVGGVALGLAVLLGLFGIGQATAGQPLPQAGEELSCLACHGSDQPALTHVFPTGEVWSLYVDEAAYRASRHGQLACSACHTDIRTPSHPVPTRLSSPRSYQLEQYPTCRKCHDQVYQNELDSVHARELAAGNWQYAPVCTDCHDPHATSDPDQPRTAIPFTCSKCHSAIYNEYLGSVHGKALVDENNLDVPTCVDCHGVHRQEDPRTTAFRLNSPQLCATCHADPVKMARYNLSTAVFNTYLADFHGTTVTLFERTSPDVATNKPVCYDCHGVHNMKSAKDPDSQVVQANLLRTCQKCHPDATENFPASWLSHYEPDARKYPLVYFVNLFYQILIPAVLGFMGLYVVVDFGSRLTRRLSGKRSSEE
jgi:predicted CXXCH cytochrome family protein